MPIYEYRCAKGHVFDVMQRMGDDPVSKCQVCGAPAERVYRAPAVHFKGSGFYNTDYGTRKRLREKESGDGGGEKSEKSSEKPAKTSETKSASSESSSSSKAA